MGTNPLNPPYQGDFQLYPTCEGNQGAGTVLLTRKGPSSSWLVPPLASSFYKRGIEEGRRPLGAESPGKAYFGLRCGRIWQADSRLNGEGPWNRRYRTS